MYDFLWTSGVKGTKLIKNTLIETVQQLKFSLNMFLVVFLHGQESF